MHAWWGKIVVSYNSYDDVFTLNRSVNTTKQCSTQIATGIFQSNQTNWIEFNWDCLLLAAQQLFFI